jgi:hypothetical protein
MLLAGPVVDAELVMPVRVDVVVPGWRWRVRRGKKPEKSRVGASASLEVRQTGLRFQPKGALAGIDG